MARKTPGWMIGCGIGCGAVLLGLVIIAGFFATWTRSVVKGFDHTVEARDALESEHGLPGDFTPQPDGAIPAERVEAFLAVREATQESRLEIAGVFGKMPISKKRARELDEAPFLEKFGRVFEIVGAASGMASELGEFLNARNQALLENGMGLGEYVYIYSLSYYSLLGYAPGDGPGDAPGEGSDHAQRGSVQVMGTRASYRTRVHLESILANQLATLPEDLPDSLRSALEAEIGAMEQDENRLPWVENLPEAIAASLEPYRERLATTYNPTTNAFELARVQKKGALSFTTD